jgi:exonuclease SbcD
VDFSEEKEAKGYVLVEVDKGQANWQFVPLPARSFCTIEVDVSESENPEATIFKALEKHSIQDAVVRLIYKIRSEQLELVSNTKLQEILKIAHSYNIRTELVSQLSRPRLPELGVGNQLDPLEALKAYLNNKKDLRDLVGDMLEAAEKLLQENDDTWLEEEESVNV